MSTLTLFAILFAMLQLVPHLHLRDTVVAEVSSPPDLLARADALFSYGEDRVADQQALALLERVLAAEPQQYQALWRAARASYHVGNEASAREKKPYFARGIVWGQQAVAQQPAGVEGHFWLGANYGGLSAVQGVFQALSLVPQLQSEMETVLQLQADYEQGNAYRALGELARQLPGVLGGNRKRALAYLQQGVRIAPQNMALKFSLARVYRKAGQPEASQQQVRDILQMPIRPGHAKTDSRTQEKAKLLLAP
jgi:tetratricopeptide (TPR) repeat protein